MQKQKSMKKGFLKGIATVAKKTSQISAGQACMWWEFDPKKPEAVKKLRKF